MKKCLFFFVFLPVLLFAADNPNQPDPVNFPITNLSGGMYTYPSANEIPDNSAAFIQNFFTDIQPCAVERNGTVQKESTVLGRPDPVTRLWTFVDTSNTEWLIAFSSRTFYKEQVGGTFSSFGFTQTVAQIPVATNNLGRIWFTDGTDPVWSFDGTTSTTIASAPLGKLIASWRNRLVIANVAGSQSTLYFSGDGNGTNWTIGGGDSDPFTQAVGGANDGYPITCLYGMYQDLLFTGRKFDMWTTAGFAQSDQQTRKLTSEIGCIQNSSMKESDGDLIWLSGRGLEKLNGNGIQLISDPIRDITDILVKNTVNQRSNTQQLSGDWGAGTIDNSAYLDTTTYANAVQLTFPDAFTAFRNGTNGTSQVWTQYVSGNVCSGNTTITASGGFLNIPNPGGGGGCGLGNVNVHTNTLLNFQQGTTYHMVLNSMPNDAGNLNRFAITLSTIIYSTPNGTDPVGFSNRASLTLYSRTANTIDQSDLNFNGSYPCTSCGSGSLPLTIDLFVATTTWQLSFNGAVVNSGTHAWPTNPVAVYLSFQKASAGAGTAQIDNFGVTPETATYTSQLLSVGSAISSWGPVSISDTKTGSGAIAYQFGSTSAASVSSISNYTSITNGGTPSVAVSSYAAFTAAFSNKNISDTASLSKFITTWNEGSSPESDAWTWDRRYWLSVTTNTATSPTQNLVLVYQRNKTFTTLGGIKAASFTRWRDNLYYGDSTGNTGLVYLYDTGNTDNGNAITSSIVTKSYDVGYPYRDKDVRKMYVGYLGSSGFVGNFTVNYDIDRSGNAYSLGSANLNDYNGQTEAKFPFPLNSNPTQGREVQYTLTKSGNGDRLRLYEFRTMFYLKEPQ